MDTVVVLLVLGMLFTAPSVAALEIAVAAHPSHCAMKIAVMQGEGRLERRPSKFAFIGRHARA